ncbi:hypothetical protein [Cupriavidus metallidurans]|uniref:hypothetical protein n=1 Tax=Cupriavidus metallidurans TaxID=119219 RepID=UPI001CC9B56B|nr:hypothetical protein [Cupriavidus metallidurans]UBM11705.1 hypothetical protein LAI70_15300 [Cupriavidus metallidurans]
MTSTTNSVAGLSYAQRVAQIICNGLYPEAGGKPVAEFPESTRANLLDIAEAILRGTPPAPAGGRVDPSSEAARALYEADMKQWFTDNPGREPAPIDTWRLGFACSRQEQGETGNYRKVLAEAEGHPDCMNMGNSCVWRAEFKKVRP